jgi:hypothetical protein
MITFYYVSGSGTVNNYGSGSVRAKSYGSYGSAFATLVITANPDEIKTIKCRLKFKTDKIFVLTFNLHFVFFINANFWLMKKRRFSNLGSERTKPVN